MTIMEVDATDGAVATETTHERILVRDAEAAAPPGMGWHRDLPDFRDYTSEHDAIAPLLAQTSAATEEKAAGALPGAVDLRMWFSPVEDQGQLGSCTANAVVGVAEYFERRSFGRHIDASRLFLYKATRDLLGWHGDTGATLRSTIGALALFGAPPEQYWPYRIARFDSEPTPFCYAFAASFRAIRYFRLDPPGTTAQALLGRIRTNTAAGVPACFGFTVYSSVGQASASGEIPLPTAGEQVVGGHAVAVAGYDDTREIRNASPGGGTTTGALLIRNSWGAAWGEAGYGWLPYEYVLQHLAADFWTLLKADWVDTGQFV